MVGRVKRGPLVGSDGGGGVGSAMWQSPSTTFIMLSGGALAKSTLLQHTTTTKLALYNWKYSREHRPPPNARKFFPDPDHDRERTPGSGRDADRHQDVIISWSLGHTPTLRKNFIKMRW